MFRKQHVYETARPIKPSLVVSWPWPRCGYNALLSQIGLVSLINNTAPGRDRNKG